MGEGDFSEVRVSQEAAELRILLEKAEAKVCGMDNKSSRFVLFFALTGGLTNEAVIVPPSSLPERTTVRQLSVKASMPCRSIE